MVHITPELINVTASSLLAGIAGGLFELYMREVVTRRNAIISLLISITMAYIAGNALCDYFSMKYSVCLFFQTMTAYLAIPLLKGIRIIGGEFVKNPIQFIKSLKHGGNSKDD